MWIPFSDTTTLGRFELVAVTIEVNLILFIISLIVFYISIGNCGPSVPSRIGPMMDGAETMLFSVFNYDAMCTSAAVPTDGKKHMPKATNLPCSSP